MLSPLLAHAMGVLPGKKKNVLFIAVDDLRPQLGCYGQKQIISPNIDKLAANGTLFENAYCQQAVCSPSRTSLLTGLRPDSCKVWDLHTFFRDTVPNVITLPQYFKQNGYFTKSLGKIFHRQPMQDDKYSWSVPSERFWGDGYWQTKENIKIVEKLKKEAKEKGLKGSERYYSTLGPPTDDADVPDNAYGDGVTADKAVESLKKLAKTGEPFFLATGFVKPHLPFSAPKKYWDMYKPEDIKLSPQKSWPKNSPKVAKSFWGELRHYYGMPEKGPLSQKQTRKLIHGYYASVTYTDAQIGKVVDQLDKLGLRDDTIIILWGDHGWKLGDYNAWCKHTNFEVDTHAPLIIDAPGFKKGQRTKSFVEFVDIYPTLAQLCDLPIPNHCEGKSMVPLLKNPNAKIRDAALSQWPKNGGKIMGYTIRTKNWRYTEWINKKDKKIIARELYDHRPGAPALEAVNLAEEKQYAETVKKLSKKLNSLIK
ncbi:MAG: iduronate sulfatase [Chlamydiae bacterium]|nr:MAG: iduronate sulfatase [Chlamydiota bacterium]